MTAPALAWIAWTGRAALAGGISWLVGRVLDRRFPDFGNNRKAGEKLADELNVKKVSLGPTADSFHNRYASPYAVMNRKYHFDSYYSNEFGFYVQLNPYLRADDDTPLADFKDLSIAEIKRIASEEDYRETILFPCNQRSRPVSEDYVGYTRTCQKYKVEPEDLKLEYVRPFSNGIDSYPAYGVKSKRSKQKDLLISV